MYIICIESSFISNFSLYWHNYTCLSTCVYMCGCVGVGGFSERVWPSGKALGW